MNTIIKASYSSAALFFLIARSSTYTVSSFSTNININMPTTTRKYSSARSSTTIRSASTSTNNNNNHNEEEKVKVAIIGGGIAGLSCAAHLSQSTKFVPTVFDTGRLRPGGRCSSRYPGDKAKNRNENKDRILNRFVIDHAAQILTVANADANANAGSTNSSGSTVHSNAFRDQVKKWEKDGVVKEFPSQSIVEILKDNKTKNENDDTNHPSKPYIRPLNTKTSKMYYGVNGMGSLASAIAYPTDNESDNKNDNKNQNALFKIEQDVWISPSNGVKFIGSSNVPQWTVQTNGKRFGSYDAIVIAHNGKCADRLMSRTPAKALHSLLRTNFNPTVPAWGGKRMTLNSIYSLTFALKKEDSLLSSSDSTLNENVITAFIKNEPTLRLLTCQTRKFSNNTQNGKKGNDDIEVWTLLSSAKFAKKYKGPQENLPKERVEEVTDLMLENLCTSLGLKANSIHQGMVLDSRLQLWGAGVPLNVWAPKDGEGEKQQQGGQEANGFLFDAENGVGVCGDWLLDPSIPGAWESGRRLSNWFVKEENQSVGLPPDGGAFRVSKAAAGSGIGNVR
jgi:hypothetical protein